MAGDKPGWYYVGNGQLRHMDGDGWTEEYKPADRAGAAKSDPEPDPASCEVLEFVTEEPTRRSRRGTPSLATRVLAAVLQLIAGLIHLMVAIWRLIVALSRLIVVGCRKAFVGLPNQSAVRQQLSLACQVAPPTTHLEQTVSCEKCGTSVGVVTRLCSVCVLP